MVVYKTVCVCQYQQRMWRVNNNDVAVCIVARALVQAFQLRRCRPLRFFSATNPLLNNIHLAVDWVKVWIIWRPQWRRD